MRKISHTYINAENTFENKFYIWAINSLKLVNVMRMSP